MIRFEILLPLYHNDGRAVDPERFVDTDDDLIRQFGAVSTDTVVVKGKWLYQSALYEDRLIRVRIDCEETPESWRAMREFKEVLKTRFEQIDIWITAHRIDVI